MNIASTNSGSAVPRWLVPDFSACLWLALLLVLLSESSRLSLVATDGDPQMHWRFGEHMLQTGRIIRTDVFSHTAFGKPYITKEWLAEVVFAIAGRAAGLFGLCVVTALLIATTYTVLHRQLVREGNDVLVAAVVSLLAAWAGAIHWLARPHVFTFLIALLWNSALRRFERDGRTGPLAATLGVLMLCWVNLHGGFMMGFVILGAYWLGAVVEAVWPANLTLRPAARRRIVILTSVGLLCLAVSAVNPNGFRLHWHNLQFFNCAYLMSTVDEFKSPDFQSPGLYGCLIWMGVLLMAMAFRQRPKRPASSVILMALWVYFGLHSVRNFPLLAILTAPMVAPAFSGWIRSRWRPFSERMSRMNAQSGGWPVVGAVALAVVVFMPYPMSLPADCWPVAAVDFIKNQPGRFQGNMFNPHTWGGYLIRVLPEHKVFSDGRADFYGEAFVHEMNAMTALQPGWQKTLEKYRVRWTLVPTVHRLNQVLALVPGWQRVYSDPVATIFVRTVDGD